jgi:hypothetical protein
MEMNTSSRQLISSRMTSWDGVEQNERIVLKGRELSLELAMLRCWNSGMALVSGQDTKPMLML